MKHKFLKFISVFLLLMSSLTAIASTFSKGQVVWLKPSDNWKEANAWFAISAGGSGTDVASMTQFGTTGYYYAYVPKDCNFIIFCRMNPGDESKDFWNRKWNQTGDITDGTKNCEVVTDWDSFSWTTYNPTFYLASDANSWSTESSKFTNGKFTQEFTKLDSHEFKIVSYKSWEGALGNNGTMNRDNHTNWVMDGSSNCKLNADIQGNYVFDFNAKTFALTVHYPTTIVYSGASVSSTVATYGAAMPSITAPTKIGYTFGGFYDGEGGTGTQYYTNTGASAKNWDKDPSTNSVTLYAKWTPKTYTITLDNKGATTAGSASVTATYNAAMPSATMPTKTGYTFGGYYDGEDGAGTQYYTSAGASAHVWDKTDDATLYAQWTEVLTSVTISSNGNGSVDPTSANVGVATTQSVTATPSTGYHFDSWAVTGNAVIDGNILSGNGNGGTGTLKATFAETLYTITVVSGTPSSVQAGISTTGQATAATAAEGKKFDKWTLGDGITLVDCAVTNQTITFHASQAATVTATYADASKFNLNVVAGTGIESVSGEKLNQTTLPIVSEISATAKTGYTFAQWTATGEGTVTYTAGSETSANATVEVSVGSVTLTASATPINYTITYTGLEGASHTNPATYTVEDAFEFTAPSAREGYTFTGWSPASITKGTTGDITVTASWTLNHHTLTWNLNGGTITTAGTPDGQVDYGTPLQAPVVAKDGYTFAGWSPSVAATMPDNDVTYTAQWTENMTTVTVNANQTSWGTISGAVTSWGATTTAGVTTSRTLTATPKPGYKFARWELADGATSTSTLTNASITIKGDGSSATGTATAIFEEDLTSTWYVRGDATYFCGWVTSADCMLKKETGHSTSNDVYYTVTLPANTNVAFKIWDETNKLYYGGNAEQGDTYWITSTSGSIQLYSGDAYKNLEIRGTVAGDYLIHFNTNTKKVEVTWPEKYFIAGNTQLTGKNWDVQGTEMTNRSYTFSNLEAGQDYRFRITDGTWDHTWGYTDLATDSDENLATLENINVHFTLTTAGDVTISIDTDKKVHVTTTGTFGEYRYTLWKIGGMKSDNWSDRVFMKKSGELDKSIAYYEVELTKDDYVFKIKNPSETYLGNEGEITGNVNDWEFYQYYADGKTEKPNCRLKATVAGTYIFKLDFTDPNVPKVSVTYPRGEGYTATITTEGAGKVQKDGVDVTEVQLYEVYGTALTAVPNDGYHFVGWTTTGNVFIDSNNKSTDSPAYFYATGTGTIKATFAKNPTIYFNNTMSKTWGADKMYVYFYSTDYWDESEYGSGAKDILAGPFAMTQIPKTNIWEYTYDPTAAPFNRTNIKGVVFSDENMPGYEHFQNCSATYRMDYSNGCANMFVLNPQQDAVLKNVSAKYYKKGFWRNYNSTTSKMYLNIWDCDGNKGIGSYELVTDEAGNEAFSATVNLSNNKRYNVYVGNCTGSNFSQKVEISSDNCSGFDLYEYESIDDKSQLAYLTTKSSGDYVFTLTFDDAHMLFSVEYPIMIDDYRVKIGSPVRYSNIIRNDQESGTISMYLNAGDNVFTYDKVTNVNVNPIVWTEDGTINVNVEKAGVYTMTLYKNKTIDNVKPYTGNYYVRTDCAQGGWQEYKTNDNNLMRYTDRNPKFVKNPSDGFNYYYCRWCANESSNVRFVVANEINACISDTMKADKWLDNDEFLKGMANIRFGWNSNTNALSRAYISGSYNDAKYMQIRSNDSKLFEYTQTSPYTEITAKSFADENDWTYTMDVLADGGAQVAVSAYYNNKYQSFVGGVNQENGEIQTTETLLKAGSKQHLRLVYDFKTDRLISGWTPSGEITETIVLDADMLLVREAQQSAAQINITTAGVEIQEIKTIYSVLQLNRDKMLSNEEGILAPNHLFENAIYWISFPFDVAVNDIFGIDGYGTKWVIQYYDGAKRAQIGWFKETDTFWTYLSKNDTIRANVGYALCLDPDFFDDEDDAIWANGRQSVSFYFPSADRDLKIVGNGTKTVPVPQHECKIDRTFGGGKNHKDTDTDWNVIGSPAFQDLKGTSSMCEMQALYQWNSSTNGYNVVTLEGFDFLTTHAYLVQFHGDINWQNASVINPTVAAPRYAYADEKNYTVELMFYFGDQWDRAYVALKDNAHEDFVLREDLTKMINSGQPNIYSYAGAYDVAYNATTLENQMVNLGVIARKNGTYTFSMPKDFSGSAILVDLEEGTFTDLNVSNYSVDLNKGTYNNRFQLMLEVEAKIPTNIENANGGLWSEDGKTQKLLINDQIYLINAGRIYNATGVQLR